MTGKKSRKFFFSRNRFMYRVSNRNGPKVNAYQFFVIQFIPKYFASNLSQSMESLLSIKRLPDFLNIRLVFLVKTQKRFSIILINSINFVFKISQYMEKGEQQ
jgi:hypothetical protein